MPEMPEKKMVAWVCCYDPWNGSPLVLVSSSEKQFADLPEDGIQGFILFHADGTRQIVTGCDWYLWVVHPNGMPILSGNNHSPEENSSRYPGVLLKRGKLTTEEWAHLTTGLLMDEKKPDGCKNC